MVRGPINAIRDLARLREISSVLIRHGLGDLVRRAGIATLLERAGEILIAARSQRHHATRAAAAGTGRAGGTRPDLYQARATLSAREDLLTAEVDRRSSSPAAESGDADSFDGFRPSSSGHSAGRRSRCLSTSSMRPMPPPRSRRCIEPSSPSGTPVILKIRRPGIEAKIDADLRILEHICPTGRAGDARDAALPARSCRCSVSSLARARA